MRPCPNCGALNEPGSVACVTCRHALSNTPVLPEGRRAKRSHTATLLGIAGPAVGPAADEPSLAPAPLTPRSNPAPHPVPSPQFEAPPTDSAREPMERAPDSPSPGVVLQRGTHAQARSRLYGKLVIGLAALLALLLGGFVWVWQPSAPPRAELVLASDATLLRVHCENCADGTVLRHGAQMALFANQVADVNLDNKLNVGENVFEVGLERPGFARDETIELRIPVRFQLEAEPSGLQQSRLGVTIRAARGAVATADGKPVPLTDGAGSAVFDLSDLTRGAQAEVVWVSHAFEFSVSAVGVTEQRSFTVRAPVVPLSVETPNSFTIVENARFMLAGRTARGAKVSVANAPITVDGDGNFAQLMSIDSEGETQFHVRAEAKDHAPRELQLRVKRVRDRRAAGRAIAQGALHQYSDVRTQLEQRKQPEVALGGTIQEARASAYSTAALLAVTTGCDLKPCLIKVVHSSKQTWPTGRFVTVIGRATRFVKAPIGGTPIPEVEAYVVLP
jgi:hypothetical protein